MAGKEKVVLLSGQQGSGKTTVQKMLLKYWNESGVKGRTGIPINFADPLYDMHNFCINYLKGLGIERPLVKDGTLLQLLGTEWGRNSVGENIWVDCLKGRIRNLLAKELHVWDHPLFVVGDCRFKNEFDGFPEALRVRLVCDPATRKQRCSQWRDNDTHASEIDLDEYATSGKFDLYVYTNQDPAEEVVRRILLYLEKNEWVERRGKGDRCE